MSALGPQGQFESFLGAISASYVERVNLVTAGFRCRSISILNMDAAIVITVSWDGVSDEIEIDPADSNSVTLDNFYPPNGTIYLKSASATPRAQILCWA